jgi:hypothetical protein
LLNTVTLSVLYNKFCIIFEERISPALITI